MTPGGSLAMDHLEIPEIREIPELPVGSRAAGKSRNSGNSGGPASGLGPHSGDAFGTLLHATGSPERVPGAILTRFWVPRGVSEDRFSFDFRCDFRLILRASHSAIPPISFDFRCDSQLILRASHSAIPPKEHTLG